MSGDGRFAADGRRIARGERTGSARFPGQRMALGRPAPQLTDGDVAASWRCIFTNKYNDLWLADRSRVERGIPTELTRGIRTGIWTLGARENVAVGCPQPF